MTKATGSGSYMLGDKGKHCTEEARVQNPGDLVHAGGKVSAERPPKKKRLGCSSKKTGSPPSSNSINRNGRSREAGDSCSYTGHDSGGTGERGPVGKF